MFNKIMCGYQGWFGAKYDDPVNDVSWFHWCLPGTEPAPDTVTFDIWPDYSEYDRNSLFYSNTYDWRYNSGEKAGFYSSNIEETVLLHCKWMRDYGIDGAFVQRFTSNIPSKKHTQRMDNVLKYMIKGGELYGLKIAVMYDITGTRITEISKLIISDWIHLVNDLKITSSPSYQYHPDRAERDLPVVGIWGFGFIGEGVRGQARRTTDFFKYSKDNKYHATLIGGVPGYWRTQDKDSKAGYKTIYERFDIISPWTVGRISSIDETVNWSNIISDDLEQTKKKGQGYMPVSFPGFSISNLLRNSSQSSQKIRRTDMIYNNIGDHSKKDTLNLIPRNGGNFMWSQLYQWRRSGTNMLYIAMFDEVDESTAIYKLAPAEELSTKPELFLTLDIDGYDLRSDHFLWMTGIAGFMIRQEIDLPEIQPVRLNEHSLRISRNWDSDHLLVDGSIEIFIILDNFTGSYFEVYRKAGNNKLFELINMFTAEETIYSTFYFIDKSSEKEIDYTYVLVVFDNSGSIIAFSDMVRTSD